MEALYGTLTPQLEAEKDEKAFQMMWGSKLNSRDAFLMILEFLSLSKIELSEALSMMKPASGRLFYSGYVNASAQFTSRDCIEYAPSLGHSKIPAKLPGWIPSVP